MEIPFQDANPLTIAAQETLFNFYGLTFKRQLSSYLYNLTQDIYGFASLVAHFQIVHCKNMQAS